MRIKRLAQGHNTWCSWVSDTQLLDTTLLANSADDKLIIFFFITKKTGFDVSCSGDNLHEMRILFSWKNEKNIQNVVC